MNPKGKLSKEMSFEVWNFISENIFKIIQKEKNFKERT